jgi:ABC-type antimicrobial peptide transport system permease subunit
MTLGAKREAILRDVLGRTARLAAIGVAGGVPLALCARPALADFVYGMKGAEGLAFAAAGALFLTVAVAAAFVPACRAASVDPALSLRAD